MYWQQTRLLPQFFTSEIELAGEKEPLNNILPKIGGFCLQLIIWPFFHAFLIGSEVFKFSRACLIIGKALGLYGLKVEIKGKIFLFSFFFTFLIWGVFKAFSIPAFIILSG